MVLGHSMVAVIMRGCASGLLNALHVSGRRIFGFCGGCLVVGFFFVRCLAVFCINGSGGVGGLFWWPC